MKKIISLMVIGLIMFAVSGYAVTTNDQTVGSTAISAGLGTPVIVKGNASFATTASGASDIYKVITIPAGYVVQGVAAKMKTAESVKGAGTYTVGTVANPTQYTTAALMTNTTSMTVSAIGSNEVYSAATTIVVCPSGVCTQGVVEVQACVIPFK